MKKFILLALAGILLAGCVVAPYDPYYYNHRRHYYYYGY